MISARRLVRPAVLLSSLVATQKGFSQIDPLYPAPPQILTTTWFYWTLPLLATMLALAVGLRMHSKRVQRTIATWPAADTSFVALCRGSLIATIACFGAVMAIFLWVAFSPRTGDEWILHRTVAMSSVGLGIIVCSIPWLLSTQKWNR